MSPDARSSAASAIAAFAGLFDEAPTAIAMTVGPHHVVVHANRAFAAFLGTSLRTLLGRALGDALPELAPRGGPDILDGVLRTGTPFVAWGFRAVLQRGGVPRECVFDLTLHVLSANGGFHGLLFQAIEGRPANHDRAIDVSGWER